MKLANHNLVGVASLSTELGIPIRWLKREAEEGRLPHVRAGRKMLFSRDAVERVLTERAGREGLRAEGDQ